MKIAKVFFPLLAVLSIFLVSCASSSKITSINATASSQLIVKSPIIQIPKLAYLNVDTKKKIEGKAEFTGNNANEDELKEKAVFEALKNNFADVLVKPEFKITTTTDGNGFKSISVEVEGFAGKYSEIRNFSKEDEELIKVFKTDIYPAANMAVIPVYKP